MGGIMTGTTFFHISIMLFSVRHERNNLLCKVWGYKLRFLFRLTLATTGFWTTVVSTCIFYIQSKSHQYWLVMCAEFVISKIARKWKHGETWLFKKKKKSKQNLQLKMSNVFFIMHVLKNFFCQNCFKNVNFCTFASYSFPFISVHVSFSPYHVITILNDTFIHRYAALIYFQKHSEIFW